MKSTHYYLFVTGIALLSACNDAKKTTDESADTAMHTTDTTLSKNKDAADLDTVDVSFFKNAAYGGLVEVESSQKIIQTTSSKDIKALAEMIVKDHEQANTELKALAESKGYMLPKALPQVKIEEIRKMDNYKNEGKNDYYIRLMIKEHQNAIDLFTAANRSTDKEISSFAATKLPALKAHYQHAMKIDSALQIPRANQGDDVLKLSDRNQQSQKPKN